tara:strand:- start:566 stop:2059 length:1494 start_codon:yes stop_codon:yes gene_type:complete
MVSSKKKFYYGFFSDIGISGIKILKILLLVPFVINFTSSELYGLYLSLVSIIGLLGLVDLGSGMYIIKEFAKEKSKKTRIRIFASVSNLIIFNIILILIVGIIISPTVSNLSPEFDIVSSLFAILLINKIIFNFSSIPTSIQISYERMGFVNLIKIFLVPIEIILVILFLNNNYGIFSLVYGELIISIIYLLIITISTKDLFKFYRFKIYKFDLIKSIKYSFSYYLVKLTHIGLTNLDNILILYFLGAKYVTIYVITLKLPILFSREVSGKISTNLFPAISSLDIKEDIKKLRSIMLRVIKFSIRASLLISLIIFIVNKSFVELWVGLENYGGYELNFIFSCILAIEFFYFALDPFVLSHGNISKFAKISLVELILNVVVSVIGVIYLGLIGIALGSLISKTSTSLLFMVIETINILNIKIKKVSLILVNNFFKFCTGLPLYVLAFYVLKDTNTYVFVIFFSLSALLINLLTNDYKIIFNRELNIKEKIILIKNNFT